MPNTMLSVSDHSRTVRRGRGIAEAELAVMETLNDASLYGSNGAGLKISTGLRWGKFPYRGSVLSLGRNVKFGEGRVSSVVGKTLVTCIKNIKNP